MAVINVIKLAKKNKLRATGTVTISTEKPIEIVQFDFGNKVTAFETELLGLRWAILQVTDQCNKLDPHSQVDTYEGLILDGVIEVKAAGVHICGFTANGYEDPQMRIKALNWAYNKLHELWNEMRGKPDYIFLA